MLNSISNLKQSILISLIGVLAHVESFAADGAALPERQQRIVPIAAHTASGNLAGLDIALRKGLDAGLTVVEIREVLEQMYAYAGFPRSLNGIGTLMKVLEDRKVHGITDAQGEEPKPFPLEESSLELGTANQTQLLGAPSSGAFIEFSPAIDYYLKAHLFGDIFSRATLNFKDREVATVAALAAMEGVVPQLKAHFNIAMNVGLTEADFIHLIAVLETEVSSEAADTAREALADVLAQKYSAKGIRVIPGDAKAAVDGPAEYFTGKVKVDDPFGKNPPSLVAGATVHFDAGARTAWHAHTMGQTLVVTEGTGLVQQWGEAAQVMKSGTTVWIPPHTKHWHGATADSKMTHVAILEDPDGHATEWMELVSDEQYEAAWRTGLR
ncbi:(R)-mandelonitrile lyase [Coraliomargarita parva]|uniref:(R)-mandelonitrile lyase n=1 Tax=Coraliomargarita parva TaxID=3014050 RepID=UPI0022B3F698|nr:carboxymuconolactone decarboxylase family protein [Coraliomargarita parva]